MTIHQAKGLEFPVVFVPDVGRNNNQVDRNAVWDAELGPLVKLPRAGDGDLRFRASICTPAHAAEDEEERIRLLYVATTRAADYLVLSAGTFPEELESPSTTWLKLLAERFDLQTGKCRQTAAGGSLPNARREGDYRSRRQSKRRPVKSRRAMLWTR